MESDDTSMEDAGSQQPVVPSLDRLKTLDSLPGLDAQLKVADELCDHGHRAEMILKWLTTRLQSDRVARQHLTAWGILTRCFRLMAPQRISILLARADLLGIVQKSMDDMPENGMTRDDVSGEVLVAIEHSLRTLIEISQGSDGAFVKRILCIGEEQAAKLFGSWISQLCNSLENGRRAFLLGDTVKTVAYVWKCRKASSSNVGLFSRHCLVPCTRVLCLPNAQFTSDPFKRKRGANPISNPSPELELLIARHVFLPLRTAFLRAHRDGKAETQTDRVERTFTPLKLATQINNNGTQELECEVVSLLLDLALRCTPMATLRQRTAEMPWVEAIFHALLNCIIIDRDPHIRSNQTLIDMLSVIQKRAALSSKTLKEIVQRFSFLTESKSTSGEKVNYQLIAKVIELDTSVFVESSMADDLFSALTDTSEFIVKVSRPKVDVRQFWQDQIIVPTLKAFASNRKLDDFIQRWHGQLRRGEKVWSWTIWRDLDLPLAEILELNMTAEKLESLFDSFHAGMKSGASKAAARSSVRSSSVILHALSQGVRSDELRERLQPRLAALHKDLLALFRNGAFSKPSNSESQASVTVHTWRLLDRTFQLWFPSWVAQLSDPAQFVLQIDDVFPTRMIDVALDHVSFEDESRLERESASTRSGDRSVVEYLLGRVCETMSRYDGSHGRAVKILESLVEKSRSDLPETFIAFPDLFPLLQKDSRRKMFDSAVECLCGSKRADTIQPNLKLQTTSLVQSCITSSSTGLAEELVEALLRPMKVMAAGKGEDFQLEPILDLILTFPASSLARAQRERIINALTDVALSKHHARQQTKTVLTAMIAMLQSPASTAKICANTEVIWEIAATCRPDKLSSKSKSGSAPSWDTTALSLLDELARLVLSHLLSTQEQERSGSALEGLYAASIGELEGSKLKGGSLLLDRLVVSKVVIQQLQQNATSQTLSAVTGETRVLSPSDIEGLAKRCEKLARQLGTSQDDFQLSVLLDLLATLVEAADSKDVALNECLGKVTFAMLPVAPSYLSSTVQVLRLLPGIQDNRSLITEGSAILHLDSTPRQRHGVLQIARKTMASLSAHELSSGIEESMQFEDDYRDLRGDWRECTLLQQALSSVSKATLERTDSTTLRALLPSLLSTLDQRPDFATYTDVFSTVLSLVRDKPFLVTQHSLESTLRTIRHLATLTRPASILIYLDLTTLVSALLTHHRARLQNRLHLLIPVLQTMQARLYTPNKPSTTTRKPLAARHARAFTRLLTLLCNPPIHRSRKATSASAGLVDETRRARAYVGQFVPSLLHSFCSLQLSGTLGEGMREALTPGLWAVIEAMEVRGPDSVKALSAAMNGSERAILRGVYEDWKRFGKWEGT